MVKFTTIRLIFTLSSSRGWLIQQIDVNNVFLNGDLEEAIYLVQPKGFEDLKYPSYIYKLNKSLYGLKQAPRAWYDKLRKFLIALGFRRSTSDFSLFHKNSARFFASYIGLCGRHSCYWDFSQVVVIVIHPLNSEFALKTLGEVHYFLGLEVHKVAGEFHFLQAQYVHDLLDRHNLLDCNPASTPMTCATKLSKIGGVIMDNPTVYQSAVGAL